MQSQQGQQQQQQQPATPLNSQNGRYYTKPMYQASQEAECAQEFSLPMPVPLPLPLPTSMYQYGQSGISKQVGSPRITSPESGESASTNPVNPGLCECGFPCKVSQCGNVNSSNYGRTYIACNNPNRQRRCGHFKWANYEQPASSMNRSACNFRPQQQGQFNRYQRYQRGGFQAPRRMNQSFGGGGGGIQSIPQQQQEQIEQIEQVQQVQQVQEQCSPQRSKIIQTAQEESLTERTGRMVSKTEKLDEISTRFSQSVADLRVTLEQERIKTDIELAELSHLVQRIMSYLLGCKSENKTKEVRFQASQKRKHESETVGGGGGGSSSCGCGVIGTVREKADSSMISSSLTSAEPLMKRRKQAQQAQEEQKRANMERLMKQMRQLETYGSQTSLIEECPNFDVEDLTQESNDEYAQKLEDSIPRNLSDDEKADEAQIIEENKPKKDKPQTQQTNPINSVIVPSSFGEQKK